MAVCCICRLITFFLCWSEDGNFNTEPERFVPEGDDSEEYRVTFQMFLSVALLHLVFIISKLQMLVSFCSSGDGSEKVLLWIFWRTFDHVPLP